MVFNKDRQILSKEVQSHDNQLQQNISCYVSASVPIVFSISI
jgi:hypothetical protein